MNDTELSISTSEQLEFIANAIPIHLNQYDAHERFIFVNKTTLEWWGMTKEEFLGKTLCELLGEKKYEEFRPHIKRVLNGENVVQEIFIKDRNGRGYYFYNAYTPHFDANGKVDTFINIGMDITEQVVAREELVESEKRFREQAKSLEVERDLRERFVSALSHDLRTPLTAAKMSAQLLARKLALDPNTQRFANRISDHIDRTDNMIRDLLDANLVKAGEKLPVKIQSCNIEQIVCDVLEDLITLHGGRFIFKKQGSLDGYWDPEAVRRITENLVNNAIKYGSSTDPITVTLKEADGKAILSVHNVGSYISPEDQNALFVEFKRTEEAKKGEKIGWGIGLSLVKGLVEAHHGSIRVESDLKRGTTFIVEVPLDARPEAMSYLNAH